MNKKPLTEAVNYLIKSILTWLFVFFVVAAAGQEAGDPETFYFENRVDATVASFKTVTARSHFMGEEAGRKYAVFHDLYSYIAAGDAVYAGPQIIIDKPAIYRSVQRANRYYRRQWRKDKITDIEAYKKVNHLLDIAISVYTQPTEALEDALRSARSGEKTADIFERIVLL